MRAFPIAKVLGLVVLIVGVAGFGRAVPASQTAPDEIAAMVDRIFATVPAEEQQSVVLKDDLERAYLAFYVSTYADVRELRAYSIPFRNVAEYVVEQKTVDDLLASGQYAEAFERLLNLMACAKVTSWSAPVTCATASTTRCSPTTPPPTRPTCTGWSARWHCRRAEEAETAH
jgi:hypothetical protein